MLQRVQRADLAIPRQCDDTADAGGVAAPVALRLALAVRRELPDAAMPGELLAGILARFPRLAVPSLADVPRGAEGDVHVSRVVERDGLGDVLVGGELRFVVVFQDQLHGAVGHEPARCDALAVHLARRAEVQVSVVDAHRRAVVAGVLVVAEDLDLVGAAIAPGVAERDQPLRVRRPELDVDDALVGDGEVARPPDALVHHRRDEAVRQRQSAVAGTGRRELPPGAAAWEAHQHHDRDGQESREHVQLLSPGRIPGATVCFEFTRLDDRSRA